MPGESAWPTSYDYNWCENTAQGQTKTGPKQELLLPECNNKINCPKRKKNCMPLHEEPAEGHGFLGLV